jgi:hypothetical protein
VNPPPSAPPKTPTDTFPVRTVDGVVRVSATCVELTAGTMIWTLVGPTAAGLRDGQRVEVTGVPDPNVPTDCVGSPLRVQSVWSM